ncbi:MAG: sigma 54-interacting transcriptional regulator [Acidobacteriota bacterium]
MKKTNENAGFMWEDGWLKKNFEIIKKYAQSKEPVLLEGKTGAGKEVISRFIHFLSKRKEKPFYPINCSLYPSEDLIQSELFGHEKGAFTGADRRRIGKLKSADGGTVLLDEVQSIPLRFQNALLRFFEYGEIHPVGSDKIEKSDVKIIAACSSSPEKLVNDGKLLDPFYSRISQLGLYIPSLREREFRDIEAFIYYFLFKECHELGIEEKEISPSALEALKRYPWPGNLRELKAVIHTLVLLSKDKKIKIDELLEKIMKTKKMLFPDRLSIDSSERKFFSKKLIDFGKEDIKRSLKYYEQSISFPDALMREENENKFSQWWLYKIFQEMVEGGKSFWDVVHRPYIKRELTKSQLKEILRYGLSLSEGSFKSLLPYFHIEKKDYKKFHDFLRRQDLLKDLK